MQLCATLCSFVHKCAGISAFVIGFKLKVFSAKTTKRRIFYYYITLYYYYSPFVIFFPYIRAIILILVIVAFLGCATLCSFVHICAALCTSVQLFYLANNILSSPSKKYLNKYLYNVANIEYLTLIQNFNNALFKSMKIQTNS